MASLDQISGGRIGWNVVTTTSSMAAMNFGRDIAPHDIRYEIAAEYVEVVKGLWDSWEEGGRVANRESGQYIDKSKVHVLDHKGRYFSVRGPLDVSRSPQGQPVIVQAGSSSTGQQFAARYAEVVFTVQQDLGEAKRFYAGMKQKVEAAGRPAGACKIFPGLFPVVGRSMAEAKEKFDDLARFIVPGSAIKTMSERIGHDISGYPMDGPVPDLPPSEKVQSFANIVFAKARRENLTLKDVHDLFATSRGYLLAIGDARTVADTIEEWFAGQACDGFMITPAHFPGALEDFVHLVVPELRRRGLFRTEYAGSTFRQSLGLTAPRNRYAGGAETVPPER